MAGRLCDPGIGVCVGAGDCEGVLARRGLVDREAGTEDRLEDELEDGLCVRSRVLDMVLRLSKSLSWRCLRQALASSGVACHLWTLQEGMLIDVFDASVDCGL